MQAHKHPMVPPTLYLNSQWDSRLMGKAANPQLYMAQLLAANNAYTLSDLNYLYQMGTDLAVQ